MQISVAPARTPLQVPCGARQLVHSKIGGDDDGGAHLAEGKHTAIGRARGRASADGEAAHVLQHPVVQEARSRIEWVALVLRSGSIENQRLGRRFGVARHATKHHSMFCTCSRNCSTATFISTEMLVSSSAADFEPSVLASRCNS